MTNIVTLHRAADRYDRLAEFREARIFFEPGINAWVVADPLQIQAILRHPDLRPGTLDITGAYERMERHYGGAYPNLLFAFRHLPLCNEGELHRLQRRRLAELIGRARPSLIQAIPALVDEGLLAVGLDRPHDLMAGFLNPLVNAFIAQLTGVRISDPDILGSISVSFDRMASWRKRSEVEAHLGATRRMIRASIGRDATDEEEGDRLTLFLLGRHATLGTLGESLYRLLKENAGVPLTRIAFPSVPPETGVPFVERVVVNAIRIGGEVLEPGVRLRLVLQSFAYGLDPDDRIRIFGMGVRACLGRQLTLDLWQGLVAALGTRNWVGSVLEYAVRDSDYVFTCPEKLVVRFSHDRNRADALSAG